MQPTCKRNETSICKLKQAFFVACLLLLLLRFAAVFLRNFCMFHFCWQIMRVEIGFSPAFYCMFSFHVSALYNFLRVFETSVIGTRRGLPVRVSCIFCIVYFCIFLHFCCLMFSRPQALHAMCIVKSAFKTFITDSYPWGMYLIGAHLGLIQAVLTMLTMLAIKSQRRQKKGVQHDFDGDR